MSDEEYFQFVHGRHHSPFQHRVTVFSPASTDTPISRVKPSDSANTEVFRRLRNKLTPEEIARPPNPTLTLVHEGSRRIDSQPATAVWRNIQYQEDKLSFAAVTVDKGAQVCYRFQESGHHRRLLSYIKRGLTLSFDSFPQKMIYNIRVQFQKRLNVHQNWPGRTFEDYARDVNLIVLKLGGGIEDVESDTNPVIQEWGEWFDLDPTTALAEICDDLVDCEEESGSSLIVNHQSVEDSTTSATGD